jgi:hypothetical protein
MGFNLRTGREIPLDADYGKQDDLGPLGSGRAQFHTSLILHAMQGS